MNSDDIRQEYARSVEGIKSKWIMFHMHSQTTKTFKFIVHTVACRDNEPIILGEIKWFGSWRRYSFFPLPNTVFEWECMRTISNVCEKMTKDHAIKYVHPWEN